MESFWANIKKRRGSSHANLTTGESSKTQSARSSHNVSREESSFRSDQSCAGDTSQEEMQPGEERWARISKFAEQVLHRQTNLPQVRLPQSFYKGLKSATLPRHFRTKSKETPMPPNTPEVQPSGSKPPSFESPRQVLKVFQKRAASVSPSRIEGDNLADNPNPKHKSIRRSFRESIRGISAERLPKPIRNFIRSHKSKSLPPERHPPKPSRRPGPVGKSWVKVYDDITYMDDPSVVDIHPIVGYTGHPTIIPDAQPLPAAPTPPPQRSPLEAKPLSTSYVESEYDNVPKRKRTHKPVPISPTQTEPKDSVVKDDTTISTNMEADNLQRSSAPTAATRTGRSREVSRYKGKRQKRTSTPINRPSISDLDDGSTPEREVEDLHVVPDLDYIVPAKVKPMKPRRRSTKVPDSNDEGLNVNEREQPTESEKIDKQLKNINNELIEKQTVENKPYHPKRGIKIYESIIIIEKEIPKDKEMNEVNENSGELNRIPPKPRRGIKIYETIQIIAPEPKTESPKVDKNDDNKASSFSEVDIKDQTNNDESLELITEMPPRPTRGSKIYANVKSGLVEKENDKSQEENKIEGRKGKVDEESKLQKNGFRDSCNGDFDDKEVQNKTYSIPLYAKVNKTRDSIELSEKNSFNDLIPPPIPPKKRKTKNEIPHQESIYDLLPPRPQRHLKPKVRSIDPSPARPKRLKTATLMNGECNLRLEIETSKSEDETFYLDDYGQKPSKPKRQTKVVKIEDITRMINENKVPLKPSRCAHGRLPAPPRRKKVEKSTSESKLEFQIEQAENISYTKDIYENVDVIDGKTIMKPQIQDENKQTPPPLPEKKINSSEFGLTSEDFSQDNLISHTVNESSFTEINLDCQVPPLCRENNLGESVREENELYKSIDMNLRNIECSFETLDEVLKSLKSYSSPSQSRIIVEGKNINADNSKPIEIIDNPYLKEISVDDLTTGKKHDLENKEGSNVSFEYDASSDISVSDEDTIISVGKNEFVEDHSDLLQLTESSNNVCEDVAANCKPIKYKLSCDGDKIIINENINTYENLNQNSDTAKNFDVVKKPSIYSTLTSTFEFGTEEGSDITSEVVKTNSTSPTSQKSSASHVQAEESPSRRDSCNCSDSEQELCESNSVIVCKLPLKLRPSTIITHENIPFIEPDAPIKPLKLSTAEQDLILLKKNFELVVTEIPVKLSTLEIDTYKFKPEPDSLIKTSSESVVTEIPVKLSTSETTTFKFDPEPEYQVKTSLESIVTEIPVKLTTSETTTFKFEPEPDSQIKSTSESIVTEIPVKLSTFETTTFIFEQEPDSRIKTPSESIVTEIPVKLPTFETTTFKFEPEPDSKIKTSSESVVTEIPVKLSTSETTTFKFIPEPNSQIKTSFESIVTEIPVKLSTSETTTFKFEPMPDSPTKTSSESIVTEIPVKLSTSETTSFKFEPELYCPVKTSEAVVTEIPDKSIAAESNVSVNLIKRSTMETAAFKFEHYPSPLVTDSSILGSNVREIPLNLLTTDLGARNFGTEVDPQEYAYVKIEIPSTVTPKEFSSTEFTNNSQLVSSDDTHFCKADNLGETIRDVKKDNENSLLQGNELSSVGESTVSELASRLEGLRSQLEAVIINYPTSPSSSVSSLDTVLSSNTSNRSSALYTAPESPLSFYSPSQSTYSMCSTPLTFYTADSEQSDASLVLSDSDRTNTPSPNSLSSSIKADDEEQTSSGEEPGEL